MATIQLQISDDLIEAYGLEAVRQRLVGYLEWELMHLSAKEIQLAVNEAGLNHDELWKQARQTAWEKFKANQLKDILA